MKDFKSGTFVKTLTGYKAFQPEMLNRVWKIGDSELLPLIDKVNFKLGELSAFSELVPNVEHFIRLHVVKEATVSSKIEGTQTSVEEALLSEEDVKPERRDDWREVNNYIKSMNNSIEMLSDIPLSSRVLRQAHQTLLQGVRGENKLPGEFRRSQNWIGGATLLDATFIPPVFADVESLMGDLENFLHNDNTNLPDIIKIALAHYQFETIHPFLDGNGRIGRLMITLYFIDKGIIKSPVLYLSDFFEKNKMLYYENLMRVRTHNDLNQWLRYFLVGTIETAEKAIQGLRNILKLKKDCESKITTLGKKTGSANILLQQLFIQPILKTEDVSKITNISNVSAYKLVADFETLAILKEFTGSQRGKMYAFEEYFEIFES
jgi:Fic family protein